MDSKVKGRCTEFNPAVLEEVDSNGDLIRSWCSPGHKPEDAFCTVCNLVIHCNQHGVSAVKRHATLKKHIGQCNKIRNENGVLKKGKFAQQTLGTNSWNNIKIANQKKNDVTVAEIKFALMVAQKDLPYSLGDTANEVFSDMFTDSTIAKEFSCSRKKLSYIISDGIAPCLREKMMNDIVKSGAFYCIQIDETPVSEKRVNQLDVLIRYFSEKYHKIVVDHVQSFHIGHCTAENLLECIIEALTELPSDKLLSFYSDGPNVMKSLKSKLKLANPQLLDIGECSLHKIHNAFSAALNSFGSDVESLLMDVYYFFKRSPAKCDDFKNLQVELDIVQHIFIRHVSSRWLTLNKSLYRFVEQLPVLKSFFDKESRTFNSRETERWKRLCLGLSDKTMLPKALFLRNVSDLFTGFLLLLQKEEPLIHILYDELLSLLKKVLGRFLLSSVFQSKKAIELKEIQLDKGDNWLKRPIVGSDTLIALKDCTKSERNEFFLGARSFYIKCSDYLLNQLPLENKLLQALQCLHPLFRYEESSLSFIRQLATAVPTVILPCNVSSIQDEWIRYQADAPDMNMPSPSQNSDENYERIDSYWNKIFSEKDVSGNLKYKYLPILVKALLALAHGNADCERGFSVNKHILESRCNLCAASINGLRYIKDELKKCGSIKKFDINDKLIRSVKSSWHRYDERTKAEHVAEKKEEEKTSAEMDLLHLKGEEETLKKRLQSTQILLKKAEQSISDGLKRKSFTDLECGQVLLTDSNKKISEIMSLLETNKTEQMKKCKAIESAKKKKKI